jgi:hypothetical protein
VARDRVRETRPRDVTRERWGARDSETARSDTYADSDGESGRDNGPRRFGREGHFPAATAAE